MISFKKTKVMTNNENQLIDSIRQLEKLLETGSTYIRNLKPFDLTIKKSAASWSKKEILGHLIDSAKYNLQRFTEIQFEEKPFKIRNYNQNELIIVNQYNNIDTEELLQFWLALNKRIKFAMSMQNPETLAYPIELKNGEISDLKYLMTDYVAHMEHHLNKIREII